MAPSLGEAKRAALANMKPPKDNLLWQFSLQDKLELQKQEIEKLKNIPQDMRNLQEKLESTTELQKDTISRLAKSTTVLNLRKEHMAMAEEMERILERFGEIEKTMKTYEDNTAQTSKTIFVLTEENETLKQRLNIFEAHLSHLANEQSNSVPEKTQTSPSRQSTANEPGPHSQHNSGWRPSISPGPMPATGGHENLTSNSQCQSKVLHSFESTSNFSQCNLKAAASTTARPTSSYDLPTNIAPSGQTETSSQAPSTLSRNQTTSTKRMNESRNTIKAPAIDSRRKTAQTYKARVDDCVKASDSPQRFVQGDKTLIKYFEETSESVRQSIMTSEADEQLSRDWMNGLADRELFKDLQKAAIGIAKSRGTKHIYWKDIEMAIWLPNLNAGMYWAKKRQMELEREEYRAEQRAKTREVLTRNMNGEPFAPPAKNHKRKL